MRITRSDVDTYAVYVAKKKQIEGMIKRLASSFQEAMGPEEMMVGYAYCISTTKEVEVSQKVDFRGELVKAIGLPKVVALEAKAAAAPKENHGPRLTVGVNPDASPSDMAAAVKLKAEVDKALERGLSEKQIGSVVTLESLRESRKR